MRQIQLPFDTSLGVWNAAGQLLRYANCPKRIVKKRLTGGGKKLTDEQVAEMRHRREVGLESVESLAAEFGITPEYATQIFNHTARPLSKRGYR